MNPDPNQDLRFIDSNQILQNPGQLRTGGGNMFGDDSHPLSDWEQKRWKEFRKWGRMSFKPGTETSSDFQRYTGGWKLEVELPGRQLKDVEVWVEGNQLIVSTSHLDNTGNADRTLAFPPGMFRSCSSKQSYWRQQAWKNTWPLPNDVEKKKITGAMKNGLLQIVLPLCSEAKTSRWKVELTQG